jgi:hypothetical protein
VRSLAKLPLVAAIGAAALGCGSRPPGGLDPALPGGTATCNPALQNCACEAPGTTGVCQHTNTPDPLPPLVDCVAPEAPYEFFDPPLWTFEDAESPDPGNHRTRTMYSYTDRSEPIASFFVEDQGRLVKVTWQPPTTAIERCANPRDTANRAIHIQGGPFLAWGGGVGIGMKDFVANGSLPMNSLERAMLDVSAWEGISFWARRGPDSQSGFRVLAGDRNTDDDINFLMTNSLDPAIQTAPKLCERFRECSCQNHMPCTEQTLVPGTVLDCTARTGSYCGEPMPLVSGDVGSGAAQQCNTCMKTRCDEEYPAYPGGIRGNSVLDYQFFGKPCDQYTFRNGVSAFYCYDKAAGERVPEPAEQCGDHWTKTVALTDRWQFFTVPFSSMTQQGFAKRFTSIDLKAVTLFRFTWDGGWIDYWIDDVRLYRTKSQPL